MNIVDPSGWLEYFADAGHADCFATAIADTDSLIVPTISLLDIFKQYGSNGKKTPLCQPLPPYSRAMLCHLMTKRGSMQPSRESNTNCR